MWELRDAETDEFIVARANLSDIRMAADDQERMGVKVKVTASHLTDEEICELCEQLAAAERG